MLYDMHKGSEYCTNSIYMYSMTLSNRWTFSVGQPLRWCPNKIKVRRIEESKLVCPSFHPLISARSSKQTNPRICAHFKRNFASKILVLTQVVPKGHASHKMSGQGAVKPARLAARPREPGEALAPRGERWPRRPGSRPGLWRGGGARPPKPRAARAGAPSGAPGGPGGGGGRRGRPAPGEAPGGLLSRSAAGARARRGKSLLRARAPGASGAPRGEGGGGGGGGAWPASRGSRRWRRAARQRAAKRVAAREALFQRPRELAGPSAREPRLALGRRPGRQRAPEAAPAAPPAQEGSASRPLGERRGAAPRRAAGRAGLAGRGARAGPRRGRQGRLRSRPLWRQLWPLQRFSLLERSRLRRKPKSPSAAAGAATRGSRAGSLPARENQKLRAPSVALVVTRKLPEKPSDRGL